MKLPNQISLFGEIHFEILGQIDFFGFFSDHLENFDNKLIF
jgi:hypothetical protein